MLNIKFNNCIYSGKTKKFIHSVCNVISFQIGNLQAKLRDSPASSQEHYDVLKQELTRRDETVQRLRREVLMLQEKRDHYQSDVSVQRKWFPSKI